MKVHIELDCSAEEARRFFGLPDVQALQASLMQQLEERLKAGLAGMDADALMRMWLPAGNQMLDQWQKFWKGMSKGQG